MSVTVTPGVEYVVRDDRVSIPELSVEGRVLAELGDLFGDGSGVTIDAGGHKYRVTRHETIVVERWDGWRYYDALEGGRLERDGDGWTLVGGDRVGWSE